MHIDEKVSGADIYMKTAVNPFSESTAVFSAEGIYPARLGLKRGYALVVFRFNLGAVLVLNQHDFSVIKKTAPAAEIGFEPSGT